MKGKTLTAEISVPAGTCARADLDPPQKQLKRINLWPNLAKDLSPVIHTGHVHDGVSEFYFKSNKV